MNSRRAAGRCRAVWGTIAAAKIVERQAAQALKETELVAAEPVTVVLSDNGWVRAAKGHDINAEELNYRAGDAYMASARGRSTQMACFLDSSGRSYSLVAHELPSARSLGEPLTGRFSPPDGAVFRTLTIGPPEARVVLASDAGYGFVTQLENLHTRQKAGKQVLTLPEGADVLPIAPVADGDEGVLICATTEGYLLAYYLSELPEMARGKGNKLIKYSAQGSQRWREGGRRDCHCRRSGLPGLGWPALLASVLVGYRELLGRARPARPQAAARFSESDSFDSGGNDRIGWAKAIFAGSRVDDGVRFRVDDRLRN